MDDLAELAASVIAFAAAENLAVVPAIPGRDCGPEVCLGPEELDLPGFLALAGRLGSGVLYLRAVLFDPDSDEHQPANPPAHLTRRKGQTGEVSVAPVLTPSPLSSRSCTATPARPPASYTASCHPAVEAGEEAPL
jgi:hypothetical protein